MYCSKCGKEIPEQSQFCKYCGTALNGVPIAVQEEAPLSIEDIRIGILAEILALEGKNWLGNTINSGQMVISAITNEFDKVLLETVFFVGFDRVHSACVAAINSNQNLTIIGSTEHSLIARKSMSALHHPAYFVIAICEYEENATFVGIWGGSEINSFGSGKQNQKCIDEIAARIDENIMRNSK